MVFRPVDELIVQNSVNMKICYILSKNIKHLFEKFMKNFGLPRKLLKYQYAVSRSGFESLLFMSPLDDSSV